MMPVRAVCAPEPGVRGSARGRFLRVGLILLTLAAAGQRLHAAQERFPEPERVLFLGNSYTYFNNLPEMVRALAATASPPRRLEVGRVTRSGATLRQLWEEGEALDQVRRGGWSMVILQEQSSLGSRQINGRRAITDPGIEFGVYARLFAREIEAMGGRVVLLLTWAHEGSPEDQDVLTHAYMSLGKELGATVVPAGLAWERARSIDGISLYGPDGAHPSPTGSYLTATTVYATLFGETPVGLSPRLAVGALDNEGEALQDSTLMLALPAGAARALQSAAWDTWRSVVSAGGYIDVPTPTPAEVPSLPASYSPLTPATLSGSWSGPFMAYGDNGTVRLEVAGRADALAVKAWYRWNDRTSEKEAEVTQAQILPDGRARLRLVTDRGVVRLDLVSGGGTLLGVGDFFRFGRPLATWGFTLNRDRP